MSGPNSYKANSEALRLAHEIVSDPETRAKIKAALEEEGKPGMSALIDEAVLVARELIRLAELPPHGPNDRQDAERYRWLKGQRLDMLMDLYLTLPDAYNPEEWDAVLDETMERHPATSLPVAPHK